MSRIKSIILVSILSMICLTGCLPEHVSEAQRKEVVRKGTELITSYLEGRYDSFSIGDIFMVYSNGPYNATYGSDLASTTFMVDDVSYNIYADISNSMVYVDYNAEEFDNIMNLYIKNYFESNGIYEELEVCSYDINMMVDSVNKCERDGDEDVKVNIGKALPVDIEEKEILDFISNHVTNMDITVCYCSEKQGVITADALMKFKNITSGSSNITIVNASEGEYEYFKEHGEFFGDVFTTCKERITVEYDYEGCSVMRDVMSTYEENNVIINYVGVREVYYTDNTNVQITDYDCPAKINDRSVAFYDDSRVNCPYAYVFFADKPTYYSVGVVTENAADGQKKTTRISLKQDPNGYYILYGDNDKYADEGYIISSKQKIELY